jgi:DNA-binding response OmpR family regulator
MTAVPNHVLAIVQTDLQLICSLRATLEQNGYPNVSVARNSQEAILYLRGVGVYANRSRFPLPSVLILDSQNPDSIDLEVLGFIREHRRFSNLPVIILCAEKHSPVHATCALDPASFLVERGNASDLLDALHLIESHGTLATA